MTKIADIILEAKTDNKSNTLNNNVDEKKPDKITKSKSEDLTNLGKENQINDGNKKESIEEVEKVK